MSASLNFVAVPYNSYELGAHAFTFATPEQYADRLAGAKNATGDVDFEHEIELLDGDNKQIALWNAVNQNISKFFENVDYIDDLDEAQLDLIEYILDCEYETEFYSALVLAEGCQVWESEDDFHNDMHDQIVGHLPNTNPMKMYFNTEAYCRDLVLNDEILQLGNCYATHPSVFTR